MLIDRASMRLAAIALLAGCWVVGGCKTTGTRRHADEARTARAAKVRRGIEKEIDLMALRSTANRDKMTWARMQIDVRLDTSTYGGMSVDEMAYATEPLFECYRKSLKKFWKKASKSEEEKASFILERELRRYRLLRQEKIIRLEGTALAPLIAEIDALCEEAHAGVREALEFPGVPAQ